MVFSITSVSHAIDARGHPEDFSTDQQVSPAIAMLYRLVVPAHSGSRIQDVRRYKRCSSNTCIIGHAAFKKQNQGFRILAQLEAKTHPAEPPGRAAQASCRQIRASTDPDKVMTALAELAGLTTDAVLAAPEIAQLGCVASAANPRFTTDSSAELASAHFAPNVDPPLLH